MANNSTKFLDEIALMLHAKGHGASLIRTSGRFVCVCGWVGEGQGGLLTLPPKIFSIHVNCAVCQPVMCYLSSL